MRITRKLSKIITDPNFNCNNIIDVTNKMQTCKNDIEILTKKENDYYEAIDLSKSKINLIQKYLYENGIISELQNKYLNTFDSEIKILFLENSITEYKSWLLGECKRETEIYKKMETLYIELKNIKLKMENYRIQLNGNRPYLEKEKKEYTLLKKQKRKLERKSRKQN